MYKYILGIEGMRCGMCELHVEESISKKIKIKKANASRFKKQVVVFAEQEITEEEFIKALEPTGYRITSYQKEEAKKTFFGWK